MRACITCSAPLLALGVSLRPQDHLLAHMTRFVRALFDRLPPLRWHVGVPRKSKWPCTSSHSTVTTAAKESGSSSWTHMTIHATSQEVPSQHTSCHGSTASLPTAVVVAVLSFPELFQDRDLLLWSDSTAARKACIDGYSSATEMAALGSGLPDSRLAPRA